MSEDLSPTAVSEFWEKLTSSQKKALVLTGSKIMTKEQKKETLERIDKCLNSLT